MPDLIHWPVTLWSLSSVLITYSACPIHPNWVSSEFKVFNCWGKQNEAKCSILVIWKAWSTLCKEDVIIVAWAAIHHRQLLWELWRPLCRCYSSLFIHLSTMTPTESNILPSTKNSKHLNSLEKRVQKVGFQRTPSVQRVEINSMPQKSIRHASNDILHQESL